MIHKTFKKVIITFEYTSIAGKSIEETATVVDWDIDEAKKYLTTIYKNTGIDIKITKWSCNHGEKLIVNPESVQLLS